MVNASVVFWSWFCCWTKECCLKRAILKDQRKKKLRFDCDPSLSPVLWCHVKIFFTRWDALRGWIEASNKRGKCRWMTIKCSLILIKWHWKWAKVFVTADRRELESRARCKISLKRRPTIANLLKRFEGFIVSKISQRESETTEWPSIERDDHESNLSVWWDFVYSQVIWYSDFDVESIRRDEIWTMISMTNESECDWVWLHSGDGKCFFNLEKQRISCLAQIFDQFFQFKQRVLSISLRENSRRMSKRTCRSLMMQWAVQWSKTSSMTIFHLDNEEEKSKQRRKTIAYGITDRFESDGNRHDQWKKKKNNLNRREELTHQLIKQISYHSSNERKEIYNQNKRRQFSKDHEYFLLLENGCERDVKICKREGLTSKKGYKCIEENRSRDNDMTTSEKERERGKLRISVFSNGTKKMIKGIAQGQEHDDGNEQRWNLSLADPCRKRMAMKRWERENLPREHLHKQHRIKWETLEHCSTSAEEREKRGEKRRRTTLRRVRSTIRECYEERFCTDRGVFLSLGLLLFFFLQNRKTKFTVKKTLKMRKTQALTKVLSERMKRKIGRWVCVFQLRFRVE